MCEDIGAEPLFVINVGMAHKDHVAMDKMGEFVQDALDAIEYANGPADSKWGSLRAKAGHPEPFHLKYMEIGNENGGPLYNERYPLFHNAIKARYPEMNLIANQWGGIPSGCPVKIVDEHYYSSPQFFMRQATKYDTYKRTGPKIYIGEYAVTGGGGAGNLLGALGEAAFMTGMERNSDIVVMGSYAPLLERITWKHWSPNAIVFDSSKIYGIPSYHVQSMFANNRADIVLPTEVKSVTNAISVAGRAGVGVWAKTKAEFKEIQVTQGATVLYDNEFLKASSKLKAQGHGTVAVADGTLVVTGTKDGAFTRLLFGKEDWTNYTINLKARKLEGPEGFLITFALQDGGKCWWNLGGWTNHEHGIEGADWESDRVAGRIETGRWYDVRLELQGSSVKCYLDGKLVHDTKAGSLASLYAVAGRKTATGEVILKVVNTSERPCETAVALKGVGSVEPVGKAIVLSSENAKDANTFDAPTKVVPKEETLTGAAPAFLHTFPANSVSILRFKVK